MSLKKKAVGAIITGAMCFGIAAGVATANEYNGRMLVAGMGGHFADAVVSIDTSAKDMITVTSLDKVDIGDGSTHPTHDARIDNKDRNLMFWSTYKVDHDVEALHAGKVDLESGEVVSDIEIKVPGQTLNFKKNYCASAQTNDYYMPISMGNPGYITVIRKADMKVMHQVYLEGTEADIKVPYKYMHGVNSPDMKEVFITLNGSDTAGKAYGTTNGKLYVLVLDAAELEKGNVKLLRKGIIPDNPKTSISFRQYFSPDGKYIANATGDILFIIDAKTLEVIDAETVGPLDQLHDAIFTPDGKYVVTTSRYKRVRAGVTPKNVKKPTSSEFWMDGTLMLYSMEEGKFVGNSGSVCLACHDEDLGTEEGDAVHAVLCGLDVNWK